jgi:hypothetical protein
MLVFDDLIWRVRQSLQFLFVSKVCASVDIVPEIVAQDVFQVFVFINIKFNVKFVECLVSLINICILS